MKLSTKGRYAVTALADIALNGAARPVTLADISERQDISLAYLEQLLGRQRQQVAAARPADRFDDSGPAQAHE